MDDRIGHRFVQKRQGLRHEMGQDFKSYGLEPHRTHDQE
jgi:hypothetical protein